MYLHEHPRRLGSLRSLSFSFTKLLPLRGNNTNSDAKEENKFLIASDSRAGGRGGSRRTSHATRRGGGQVSSWWKNSIPLRCSSSLDRNFLGRTQEKRLMSIASLVECFVSKTVGCGRLFHDIFHRFVWPTNDQSFSCDPLIVAHRQTIAAAEEMTSSRASLAW